VCLIRGFLISDEESSYEEALEAAQIRGRSQPTMPGSTEFRSDVALTQLNSTLAETKFRQGSLMRIW
jgi:hypothetical protein